MTQHTPGRCQVCSMYYDAWNFCAHLSASELEELNANSRVLTFKRGESIHGDLLDHWPIVAVSTGVLSLQHLLNDGRKIIAAIFKRGDILDLRNAPNRQLGDLVALSKAKICSLSPPVFDRIMAVNAAARVIAWENLTDQAFRAINHASDLAKKQALEKLASFIFECRHRNVNKFPNDHVEIPIRRRDLADYLGMQPETVSRSFKELEDRGIIKVSDLSVVRVLEVHALRRIANGDRVAQGPNRYRDRDGKILSAGG